MNSRALRVSLLLFGSGLTALVYQIAWMRELRLIFGFSTAASAAVVAIFMGGLGIGGWILGRRADQAPRPLAFYGWLELAIAGSAALTPALLWLVRAAYIAVGGSARLGLIGGSLARLVLSALVLAVPTVLMGGTLPAATRAVETQEDSGRRLLALLYGSNTLGAVAGTLLSGNSARRYFISNNPHGVAGIALAARGGQAVRRDAGRLSVAGIRFANGGREFPNEGLESVSTPCPRRIYQTWTRSAGAR